MEALLATPARDVATSTGAGSTRRDHNGVAARNPEPSAAAADRDLEPVTLTLLDARGQRRGEVRFEAASDARPSPPADVRADFVRDLRREIERVECWSENAGWQGAWPSLRVTVADRYKISKSLVPAWNGERGRMEFPTWRVSQRKAAIAHELVHIVYPNANRFLAEGLAVHLQAEIGGNPAFPNFGRPLHAVAREVVIALLAEGATAQRAGSELLPQLDAIGTPFPLTLRIGAHLLGEEPRGQARIYPLAGSFTAFIIETHGLRKFRELYAQTPLVPHVQDAGSAERWQAAYGLCLGALEREWRSMLLEHRPRAASEQPSTIPVQFQPTNRESSNA